jgi:hypothetical protein
MHTPGVSMAPRHTKAGCATENMCQTTYETQPRPASAFKLKVVLVEPVVEIGKQGFNVNLAAPKASYTVVAYALGLALYEVQEIINRDASDEEPPPSESIEALPVPEPIDD